MAYTAQFKLDAIKLGDEVGNRKAAQELGVNGEKVERAESLSKHNRHCVG